MIQSHGFFSVFLHTECGEEFCEASWCLEVYSLIEAVPFKSGYSTPSVSLLATTSG